MVQKTNKDKIYNVGLIGLGFGRYVHLPAIKNTKRLNLASIFTKRDPTSVNIDGFDGALITNSLSEFCEKIDVAIIAVPPNELYDLILFLSEKSISLFVEKPLIFDKKNLILDINKLKKSKIFVNYSYLSELYFHIIKDLIDCQTHGRLESINVYWAVQSFANLNKTENWKSSVSGGGGVMNLLGSHTVSILNYLVHPLIIEGAQSFQPLDLAPDQSETSIIFQGQGSDKTQFFAHITNNTNNYFEHSWKLQFCNAQVVLSNRTKNYFNNFYLDIHSNSGNSRKTFKIAGCRTDDRRYVTERTYHEFIKYLDDDIEPLRNLKFALEVDEHLETIRNLTQKCT